MKILLAYPYFLFDRKHEDNITAMPMGMHYLGAVCIAQGHEVRCVNWSAVHENPQEITATLQDFKPDVIGFSIFHGNRWGALDIAQFAKEALPGVKIVFGGVGATFLAHLLLQHFNCIDAIVKGEAETSFPALLQAFATSASLHEVPGVLFRDAGNIVATKAPPLIENLDDLPMPAEHFTFQHLALTRGCPGKCTFCGSPKFWGTKVRFHSPEYFVKQMQLQYARGIRFFYVSDDTFTLKKQTVLRVCELITESGMDIQWAAISRVDRVDAAVLTAMRKAGCIQISYGVESGSPHIRSRMRKNINNEQIEQAFRLTMAHGILARAYVIYGSPGETDATIQETMDLIRAIKPCITLFHVMSIFPGTELYDELIQNKKLSESHWLERNEDLLWLDCTDAYSIEQVIEWGKQLKQDYFSRLPEYVRNVQLADIPDLRKEQADFLSRLGFTFEYGEYAELLPPKERAELAHTLYQRALDRTPDMPDPRAALGMSMHLANAEKKDAAIELLEKALQSAPNDTNLSVQLAQLLLERGRTNDPQQAKALLHGLESTPQIAALHAACERQLQGA